MQRTAAQRLVITCAAVDQLQASHSSPAAMSTCRLLDQWTGAAWLTQYTHAQGLDEPETAQEAIDQGLLFTGAQQCVLLCPANPVGLSASCRA
jgi:hypothetical protein